MPHPTFIPSVGQPQAPHSINLTLVPSGGLPTTPPTGHLTLITSAHLSCPAGPCEDQGPHHGDITRYVHHRCRCTSCRAAAVAYAGVRRRLKAYGRWHPTVDAAPVRAHVQRLTAAGLTWRQISEAAAVNLAVIRNLLHGGSGNRTPSRTVREGNAKRLLAVPVPSRFSRSSGLRVAATGTRRRAEALITLGFSTARIAHEAGLTSRTVSDLTRGCLLRVSTRTAVRMAGAYDRLWDRDPVACGVRTQDVRLSVQRAGEQGWAPPMAWDELGGEHDIDDPTAWPDWTGRCGTTGGYQDHRVAGTPTCARCRRAVREAAAERKARRRARVAA